MWRGSARDGDADVKISPNQLDDERLVARYAYAKTHPAAKEALRPLAR